MPTDYQVLLDPALGVTAADFAAAWAEIPECAQAGLCKAGVGRSGQFQIDMADATTIAAITMVATLAKDLIMELVKGAVARARERDGKKRDAEPIVELTPDAQTGLPLIRVTRRKDQLGE